MFFSLQIIWYPIAAGFSLLLRILWRRTTPENEIEIVDRPSTLRSESVRTTLVLWMCGFVCLRIQFDSTATTIKQDLSHVKVVEVPEDCSENAAKECKGGND